jgi:integrase
VTNGRELLLSIVKLTQTAVDNLPVRSSTYVKFDAELPGFGCRVTPAGSKSWVVEYRPGNGGRRVGKKRVTLGSVATLLPDRARKAAKDVLARARLGEDPAAERAIRRQSLSVAELIERYMAEEVRPTRKAGTAALYDLYFRRHVRPDLGIKLARDLNHTELVRLHRRIGKAAPVTANRVLTLVSAMLSWAVRVGELPEGSNPAKGITKFREQAKERFLSAEELAELGDVLREAETVGLPWDADGSKAFAKHSPGPQHRRTKLSPHVTAAIRLLLFTGCRLREILHLKWEHVDFERGMLFLPDSKTGRKPVVLAAPAVAVLQDLARMGEYVIVGNDLRRPRHDLQRPWRAITQRAGLDGLRIHDLRHSFAAMGAGSGFSLPVIGKLLGHRNLETTNRYAHLGASPLKVAADRIANQLAKAMGDAGGN